jgi:hypothetical protein
MGWDISYHPVDLDFFHTRIIPYVRGEGSLDSLMADAMRISKARFRAKAWALGLSALDSTILRTQYREHKAQQAAWEQAHAHENPPVPFVKPVARRIPGFDSDVHVWGRPFFITHATVEEVSAALDGYLKADEGSVDRIAKAMLGRLDMVIQKELPGMDEVAQKAMKPCEPSLVQSLQPDTQAVLPADDELVKSIRGTMDLFRDAFAAARAGRMVKLPDGSDVEPGELFATDFPLAALTFASIFRPGWMARGRGWPSLLLAQAGLPAEQYFEEPLALFEPLLGEIPVLAGHLESTITQNYSLGGYVPAGKVASLRALMEAKRDAFVDWAISDGWEAGEMLCYLRGIDEALFDAGRRGLGFVEAAEVYSGFSGIMN